MPSINPNRFVPFALLLCYSFQGVAQGIHPQNLFESGVQMGYLMAGKKNNTAPDQYAEWAGNASAKWIDSWTTGLADPIVPDIANPTLAHDQYMTVIRTMQSCADPHFQARLSLYRVGVYLGQAIVESGFSCSSCLQIEMQRASIELQTLSSLLKQQTFSDLAKSINTSASSLTESVSEELAQQRNEGLFPLIESAIQTVSNSLPRTLVHCPGKKEERPPVVDEPPPVTTEVHVSQREQPTSHGSLTVGLNSGYLTTDKLPDSETGSGWFIAFDWSRGNPVFFQSGLKFYRNTAGKELLIPLQGQMVDSDDKFIQGFVAHLGIGGLLYQEQDIRLLLDARLNYFLSHWIGGSLSSIGYTSVTDNVFHLQFGAGFAYKFLYMNLSYEFGLSPALVFEIPQSNLRHEFTYRMFNFGVGVYLE